MIAIRCGREEELLEALSAGRWPEATDLELKTHVEGCRECREILTVAEAFADDRREIERNAHLPSSGMAWWRVQLRMEREAKEAAAKTVRRAHGAVLGLTIVAMTLVLLATSAMKAGWLWIESSMPAFGNLVSLSTSVPPTLVVLLGVALLVFAPVALYLAIARE